VFRRTEPLGKSEPRHARPILTLILTAARQDPMGDEQDAQYHRTFEKFSMGMWPVWKKNPIGWNYRGQEVFRQEQEDAHAARVGAFYAYQRVGDAMQQVRVMPKSDQNFFLHATKWELTYSTLVPTSLKRAEPVVDDNFALVGHYGWFSASEILIPKTTSATLDVKSLIDSGDPIFADLLNPMPAYYKTDYVGTPEWKFLLLTGIDGEVVGMFSYDVGYGAIPTTPPWEYIAMARAAFALVKTGVRQIVKTLARRGTARTVASGPTVAAAEKAAEKVAKQTATAIPKQARKVSQADMLKWEKEGGHVVQNHGPQLTRQNLKSRVTGKEEIAAPQMQPGGVKPADLRVWRGQKTPAASKWESDEVMRKAIGETIDKNIDKIRQVTSNGGEVILEQQAAGYTTGSGWVTAESELVKTAGQQAAPRGAFYVEKLDGLTIVIRARKNFTPTAADPEGWYVHTAFPEMAR
jgi:hypothetical protein